LILINAPFGFGKKGSSGVRIFAAVAVVASSLLEVSASISTPSTRNIRGRVRLHAPALVSQYGRGILLLDDVGGIAPQDDADAAFAILLLLWQCVNAVFVSNIYVATERK